MSETSQSPRPGKDIALVVLGAVLALPTALAGGWLSQINEQQSFLREERAVAYEDFLTTMSALDAQLKSTVAGNSVTEDGDLPDPSQEQLRAPHALLDEMVSSFNRVQVIGSSDAFSAAEGAMDRYQNYVTFLAERLIDLDENDPYTYDEDETDWFYDGGAEFMAVSLECLEFESRIPYLQAIQRDLGVAESDKPDSYDTQRDVCDLVDWANLYVGYSDAMQSGTFG